MKVMRLWVLWVCFVVLCQALGIKCCVREEREALLNIKTYLQKSYNNTLLTKKHLSSWVNDSNSDCCTWNRVECHPSSGLVSKLSLQALADERDYYGNVSIDFSLFQNFKELTSLNFTLGQFQSMKNTAVLGNLSNLEVLVLKSNSLGGSLPLQEICKLKKIRVLDFSYNEFNGSLHKCLANLTSLQALDLSSNDLTGEIPAYAIASLTSLEYFSAQYNDFRGIFPLSSFANNSRLKVLSLQMYGGDEFQVNTESEGLPWIPLFQLEVLVLGNCKVNAPSGNLPSFLLYQHDLHYLDLSNNDLVGVFPNWLLLNNTNLKSLILRHNKFIGAFEFPTNDIHRPPPHPLIHLVLSDNKMEGELPKNIGLMFPNLEYLIVSGNGLHGSIPPSTGNISKLHGLDLSRNKFSSEVPDSLWAGCSSLEYLNLAHNNLEGRLFASHMNSSSLIGLFLGNNYLNGTLEHGIWHLPNLEALDISNNSLSGMVPTFISNSSYLHMIDLSRNNFTGTPPKEFCKLDLSYLQLSLNKFSGSIPACYFNNSLSVLQLQGNNLVGSIPILMRSSDHLSALDLRDNKLSGVIPDWILNGTFLSDLLLGGNQFHGQLPDQLCQLKDMSFLDLSRNKFTGNIPACFDNISFGELRDMIPSGLSLSYLDSSYHYYNLLHLQLFLEPLSSYDTIYVRIIIDFTTKNLRLPYEGYIMEIMSGIDLSSNQLTGKIPHEMGYLKSLHVLNLSNNHLHGSIPRSFHNLGAIESIDISNNNLNGEIPIQLQNLNSLSIFNVSFNNLSGTVPNSGQFSTFDDSCFKGNQYLVRHNNNKGNSTYVPPPSPPPLNNDTKEDESIIDFTSFIWSFCACYVAVLVVMATVLWINPYWRRLWFYYIETCLYRYLYPYLKDAFW